MNGYYEVHIKTEEKEFIVRQIIEHDIVIRYEDKDGNRVLLPKLHDATVVGDFVGEE